MEEIFSEDFLLDSSGDEEKVSPNDDLKQLLQDANIKVETGGVCSAGGDFNINQIVKEKS